VPDVPAPRLEIPFVGREEELAQVTQSFSRCRDASTCCLVTVLGPAGIGKSRLALEAQLELGVHARVLKGRCLPYGDGITFWPVREMLADVLEDAVSQLEPQEGGWIANSIAGLIGRRDPDGGLDEAFLAIRTLLELLAEERPLVLVFEDIHWAEPTLLDLVEQIADLTREAPMLIICLARTELLDQRPGWGSGNPNATTIPLEQLSDSAARQIADWLLADGNLSERTRTIALDRAEGNPLFLEQLLVHAREGTAAPGDLPPTIEALLAARLDRLDPAERAIIECAALVGRDFDLAAVSDLVSERHRPIESHVDALVHKELVRPTRGQRSTATDYRFRHILIRDAAYASMPKQRRSELHERHADWLDRSRPNDPYADEMVGYHLERAHVYRVGLVAADERAASLAARAAQRLELAGRKALGRGDLPATIGLLERATPLLAEDLRAPLLTQLGSVLLEAGKLERAGHVLTQAQTLAAATRDDRVHARALVELAHLRVLLAEQGSAEEGVRVVKRVIPIFERHDDELGLCSAWRLSAWLHWSGSRAARAAEAWERAAVHAARATDERAYVEILTWVATALWFGPTPVSVGIRRAESIADRVAGHKEAEALLLRNQAGWYALNGDFESARSFLSRSRRAFENLGQTLNTASSQFEGFVELLAGDPAAAEDSLRKGYKLLDEMGERTFLSTTAAFLAHAIFAQGRAEEAEALAARSAELVAEDDVLTQSLWRSVQARVLARRGAADEAVPLAREAVRLVARTDFLNDRGDALLSLAAVLDEAGRRRESAEAVRKALRLYDQKGNVVAASTARSMLGEVARL
jgi:predicted ATPase